MQYVKVGRSLLLASIFAFLGCSAGGNPNGGNNDGAKLTKDQVVGTYEATSFGTFHTVQFTKDGKFKSGVAGKADKEEGTWRIERNVVIVHRTSKDDDAFEFAIVNGALQMVKAFGKKAKQTFDRLE